MNVCTKGPKECPHCARSEATASQLRHAGGGAMNLEALACLLRGAGHGPPLEMEGAWDELTQLQRDRWLLFASRAWGAVLRLQREAAEEDL